MKKRVLAIMLCSLFTLSMTACSSTSKQANSQTSGKTVIKFFHRWPNEPRNSYYKEVVAEFEKQNPDIKVQMDCVLNDSYKEKIRVLVSSNDIPDIFTSWSDSFAENLVASGKVKALDDLYAKNKDWSSQIVESQIKPFTFNSKIYGVPLTLDGKAFFYNKDIFQKNGLTPPKTFDEFIDVLEKLKSAGYKTPLIEGLSDAWAISHYLGTMNQRMLDPTVLKKDYNAKTGEFTDPGYVKVLENFKKLTGYMGQSATSIDHETARNMFSSGEVPIMYLQFAEIKMVKDAAKFSFGYFDFPTFSDGKGNPTALTGAPEGYMLSNISKNPEAVEKFLKFLTSKENAAKLTKQSGQLTAIKGAVTSDNASQESIDAYQVILKASETAPWFDNAVNINIADAFMRGGQSLATGEMKPQDVMKNVQKAALETRNSAK